MVTSAEGRAAKRSTKVVYEMGSRGPVPKRSEDRIRQNKDYPEVTRSEAGTGAPSPYEAGDGWHPIARSWYESLERSGQTRFYEESDWATAYFLAEAMSRELNPQFIGMSTTSEPVLDDDGNYLYTRTQTFPIQGRIPIKGASLSAIRATMAALLVTEGDRRRASIELQKGGAEPDVGGAAVLDLMEKLGAQR